MKVKEVLRILNNFSGEWNFNPWRCELRSCKLLCEAVPLKLFQLMLPHTQYNLTVLKLIETHETVPKLIEIILFP